MSIELDYRRSFFSKTQTMEIQQRSCPIFSTAPKLIDFFQLEPFFVDWAAVSHDVIVVSKTNAILKGIEFVRGNVTTDREYLKRDIDKLSYLTLPTGQSIKCRWKPTPIK
jgi:hypothetical protein